MARKKPEEVLDYPTPSFRPRWVVVGLDPSLSRTGYAQSCVGANGSIQWNAIKSIKPDNSSDPVWARQKLLVEEINQTILDIPHVNDSCSDGIIIVLEYPTPGEDRLVAINRMFHAIILPSLLNRFDDIRILHINAATLRSVMALTQRGRKNKKENIERAYSFVSRSEWPSLDTDSCDAVLLAQVGIYVAKLLEGCHDIPPVMGKMLCSTLLRKKGKGLRERMVPKGILHRPEYWALYEPAEYSLAIKDAATVSRKLEHKTRKI